MTLLGLSLLAGAFTLGWYLAPRSAPVPPPDRHALPLPRVMHVSHEHRSFLTGCSPAVVAWASDAVDVSIRHHPCVLAVSGDYPGKAKIQVLLFDQQGYAREILTWRGRVEP